MSLLTIVTISFMVLEFSNVLALYGKPDFKYANAVGMFKAWEKSKEDPDMHDFVKYLVNWVAGTKLIFLMLLVVILIFGDEKTQIYALLALILSILTFYWKLYPLIKKMDKNDQIDPKNYSKTLGLMIFVFVLALSIAFVGSLLSI
ncbi:hypothetical protein DSAG12_02686 [Promethearchaeum syntrophicum]|uniref:Uncharacterized protein n=1 Tax=Promethearchaeum syntrophicum TaxID=2594042 RepID=A0A5B9DDQ6_9ARCH|nr:hypothetical protein [Candidatus Prometheoarchaeum syntrophicum]QEE16856.1 hypothetical protein DSAG12_02686 [Candidatus Prometheoarchaeum syntrophicum]